MAFLELHVNGAIHRVDVDPASVPRADAYLDNSAAEQILKRAVLYRKNSLLFKTENGSLVADTILSLIETCWLNSTNAFDYLVTLMRNARAVRAMPSLWLPWNYQQNKARQIA